MDECTEWELNDIIENIPYLDRNLWESTRLNTFLAAKPNYKNIKQLKDICSFKWEDSNLYEKPITDITKEDISRLKKLANSTWTDTDEDYGAERQTQR